MENEMLGESPIKIIIKFTIPIMIGNIFQQFYNIVDSIIVGRYVGVNALAAVGVTSSLVFFLIGMITGMTSGFAIFTAQTYGAQNMKLLRHYLGNSIYLCVLLTILLTFCTIAPLRQVLHLMQTPDEIMKQAYDYMWIIAMGTVATVTFNMLSGVLRGIGDSKNPLYVLILSSLINVILDYIFIVEFNWGVKGAAYATVVAQIISSIVALVVIIRKYSFLKLDKEDFKFSLKSSVKLLGIGIPMALQFSITSVGTMIVQTALNHFGSLYIAAFATAGKIQTIIIQPFVALGATMATYVGQNMGAGDLHRITQGVKSATFVTIISAVIIGTAAYIFGENFVAFFLFDPEPEIYEASQKFFHTVAWFYPVLGLIFLYRNTLQGLGDGLLPMIGGVFELVARALVVMFLPGRLGFEGICMAHPIAWASALLVLIPFYIMRMKRVYR